MMTESGIKRKLCRDLPREKGEAFEVWNKELLDAGHGEGDEDASWSDTFLGQDPRVGLGRICLAGMLGNKHTVLLWSPTPRGWRTPSTRSFPHPLAAGESRAQSDSRLPLSLRGCVENLHIQ